MDAFARSLVAWLHGHEYSVGLTGRKIDCPKLVQWANTQNSGIGKALTPIGPHAALAGALFGLLLGTMTGGASAQQVTEKLRPFAAHVDLLGFKVVGSRAVLHPVLFADDVAAEDLNVYIQTYAGYGAGLKELVTRGFFAQTPTVDCDALLVYFDPDKAAQARTGAGYLYFDKRMVRVRGVVVDVSQKSVVGARATSVSGALRQALGTDDGDFDATALRTVLLPPRGTDLDLG